MPISAARKEESTWSRLLHDGSWCGSAGGTAALAVKTDGTVWTRGDNTTGQLGDGAACGKTCTTPVQAIGLTSAGSIAGGYVHSLAETINGSVYGWGDNSAGELGNGTTTVATELAADPADVLRRYLSAARTDSARALADKAAVLIVPSDRAGEIIWPDQH